ncbi:MAG: L,D-transpeptidase [Nitratireductor sp.]
MKNLYFAASLAASLFITTPLLANDRYSTPPAATLYSDLTAPWLLQLKQKPTVRKDPYTKRKLVTKRKYKKFVYKQNRTQTRPQKIVAYSKPVAPKKVVKAKPKQKGLDPKFLPQVVVYNSSHKPGTIVISTDKKFLYLVMSDNQARRYGVGVGKQGFTWTGTEKITRKAEWPGWTPPKEMIAREKKKGRDLPAHMPGGPKNPLGARSMYLGSTLYRIHGTTQPWSIGLNISSGCIRMRNEDVIDLYERVRIGAKVIVT